MKISLCPNKVRAPHSLKLYQTKGDGGPLLSTHLRHKPRGSCSPPSPNPQAATADGLPCNPPTCRHREVLPRKTQQLEEPGARVSSHSGHAPQRQGSPGSPSHTAGGGTYMRITSLQGEQTRQDLCTTICRKADAAQSREAGISLRFLTSGRKGE